MKNIRITPEPILKRFGRAPARIIAGVTGLSRPTIYNWLSGNLDTVDLRVLAVWCDVCDASPGDFIKFEEVESES